MTYTLFEQVALTQDIPEKNLRRGDVATIVEHHPMAQGEDGYSLELFNGIGETIAVITVPESAIQPLSADNILHIRAIKMPA
jgi:hypothetical protein